MNFLSLDFSLWFLSPLYSPNILFASAMSWVIQLEYFLENNQLHLVCVYREGMVSSRGGEG